MTWLVQPSLVNEPFSDPGLFIDFRFGRRALLFVLGDLTPLSPRQLLRVSHAFVSHAHMDHFSGFDRLLRVCLHRTVPLHLFGPAGFGDRVDHKLKAYTLNLLDEHACNFVITACDFNGDGFDRMCEFRAREGFHQREVSPPRLPPGTRSSTRCSTVRYGRNPTSSGASNPWRVSSSAASARETTTSICSRTRKASSGSVFTSDRAAWGTKPRPRS